MADLIRYGVAETGTWQTGSPTPHIDLDGGVPGGVSIFQRFNQALVTGEFVTVTVRKDADNWACYGYESGNVGTAGPEFTSGSPDVLDFSAAELRASKGTLSNGDAVEVWAEMPEYDSAGGVTGPGSSADNGITLFDGVSGDTIKGLTHTLVQEITTSESLRLTNPTNTETNCLHIAEQNDNGALVKVGGSIFSDASGWMSVTHTGGTDITGSFNVNGNGKTQGTSQLRAYNATNNTVSLSAGGASGTNAIEMWVTNALRVTVNPTDVTFDVPAILDGYTEKGDTTLTSVAGTLTIPLDGKPRTVTLTENVTLAATAPSAPECGNCKITIIQAIIDYTVTVPAGWYKDPDGDLSMVTGLGNRKVYLIDSDPDGEINILAQNRVATT